MMKYVLQGFGLFILILSGKTMMAENALFLDETTLNVVLTAPLTQAYNEKNKKDRLWMPGQLAYTQIDGSTNRHNVSIRTRGIFRRQNCTLPPLQLNFKKKELKGSLFDGQDKLKLVAPCNHSSKSQQLLLLEHLAYQTLQLLTPDSLKTRLVRISYIDSDNRKKPWTHLAFLIEHEKDMAKRLGLKPVHVPKIHSSTLDPEKTALVEIFQFLIANNDYSIIRGPEGRDCCHNMELLSKNGTLENIIPVPYDFDVSGLVNADYAAPPEKLKIKSVRTRYFRGRCKPPEIWDKTFSHVLSKRGQIISLFENANELTDSYKAKTLRYVQKFFDILDNPSRVQREIIGRCLG